jgi:hypothetical protein
MRKGKDHNSSLQNALTLLLIEKFREQRDKQGKPRNPPPIKSSKVRISIGKNPIPIELKMMGRLNK